MRDLLWKAKATNRTEDGVYVSHYKNGDWVFGLVSDIDTKYGIVKMTDIFGVHNIEVDPETVGQFTGLYDSTKWEELTKSEQQNWLKCHAKEDWKGKPIFEGDIVRGVAYGSEWRGVIIWIEKIASFGLWHGHDIAWENCSILKRATKGMHDEFAAKVIGNIHDNPELLEETK